MHEWQEPHYLLAVARRAAVEGAAAVRAVREAHRYTGTINEGGDRVLLVDLAADRAVHAVLQAELGVRGAPYAALSEESGVRRFGGEYPLFVIDPVDGSAQARRRHPDCCVSVAVALGPTMGDLVAGVVQPMQGGDPYHAVRGEGAYRGDLPLPLIPVPEGAGTSVLIEGSHTPTLIQMASRFAAAEPGWQLHISGSIALQLALLAAGCYDVLVAARAGAAAYDIAAGWLIAREAGVYYGDAGGLETPLAPLVSVREKHHAAAARRADLLARGLEIAQSDA